MMEYPETYVNLQKLAVEVSGRFPNFSLVQKVFNSGNLPETNADFIQRSTVVEFCGVDFYACPPDESMESMDVPACQTSGASRN